MKYTKEQLNNNDSYRSFVCQIDNEEEYWKVKEICPKMIRYNTRYKRYLLPRMGQGTHNSYNSFSYIVINIDQIEDLNTETYGIY